MKKIINKFEMRVTLKQQIKNLREAIKKEEEEIEKAEAYAIRFKILQKTETKIKNRITRLQDSLKNIQEKIVEQMLVTFDVSDDMTMEAAKETLINLENKLNGKDK